MPDDSVSRTPFRDRGSTFSVGADTLDAVYQRLQEAGGAGAAELLRQEAKLIISPLVWTLDDLTDLVDDPEEACDIVADIDGLEDWEPAIECVNQLLAELVESRLEELAESRVS